MLDRDIFSIDPFELHSPRVQATYLDGREVYSAKVRARAKVEQTSLPVDITYGFIHFVVTRRRRSRFHQACLATILTAFEPFLGRHDKYAIDRGNLAPEH